MARVKFNKMPFKVYTLISGFLRNYCTDYNNSSKNKMNLYNNVFVNLFIATIFKYSGTMTIKIITFNVNGIRAASKNGLKEFIFSGIVTCIVYA